MCVYYLSPSLYMCVYVCIYVCNGESHTKFLLLILAFYRFIKSI